MPFEKCQTSLLAGFTVIVASCTPQYPKCDKDEHCQPGEFCVNGQCQLCRKDGDCQKGYSCKHGRCEVILGYCNRSNDCPSGEACVNNRCTVCKKDADCGQGWSCRQSKCKKTGSCSRDEDCEEDEECQNGKCVGPPTGTGEPGPCNIEPIYFDFDEFVLNSRATHTLGKALPCIKKAKDRTVLLEGHCDPRGTEEYNIALGERRSQAVKRYLMYLGVSKNRLRAVSKGKLEAIGNSSASWVKDRKVIFIWE